MLGLASLVSADFASLNLPGARTAGEGRQPQVAWQQAQRSVARQDARAYLETREVGGKAMPVQPLRGNSTLCHSHHMKTQGPWALGVTTRITLVLLARLSTDQISSSWIRNAVLMALVVQEAPVLCLPLLLMHWGGSCRQPVLPATPKQGPSLAFFRNRALSFTTSAS